MIHAKKHVVSPKTGPDLGFFNGLLASMVSATLVDGLLLGIRLFLGFRFLSGAQQFLEFLEERVAAGTE